MNTTDQQYKASIRINRERLYPISLHIIPQMLMLGYTHFNINFINVNPYFKVFLICLKIEEVS